MLIEANPLIAAQVNLAGQQEMVFPDGRKTLLTAVQYVPQLADEAMTVSLDGPWRVTRWPFAKMETALAAPRTSDAKWELVQQPGKVFSYDASKTADDIKGWDRIGQTHIAPEDGAVLRRRVAIPRAWRGKRVLLRFDAIYPAARVYLDGELLGEHTSGLTPVEFDVTDLVTPGREVVVAVRLLRWHKFIKMDMPRHGSEFAGLAQSACFFAVEPCHVREFFLPSSLDASLRQGSVGGEVEVCNGSAKPATGSLSVQLADGDGKVVAKQSLRVAVGGGKGQVLQVGLKVRNPRLWNDELPNLYQVTLQLKIAGQAVQTIAWRTGFRRLDLSPAGPKLNGNPVKFRGVNHLTYHPQSGLHTPREWLRQCLGLMKKANINCIRTHYLGPRCLAELCDEMGIYLIQELPIDWGTDYIADVEWVGPALQRIMGGILRDRHRCSVMVWSIGNENMPVSAAVADDGWNHLRIYEQFAKTLDPTRATMFPPPGPANKIRGIFEVRVGDIADTHYSFTLVKKFQATGEVTNPRSWTGETETTTREEALARGWSGVWFSSEYGIQNCMPDLLNAPYTSIIADVPEDPCSGKNTLQVFTDRLRSEWGLMRQDPTCLGGAYFPWICGAAGDNPWGHIVWAEDNDWGPVTADLLPKPFFWAMRNLFSPVWFPTRLEYTGGNEVAFEVTNHYNAIDLKQCTIRTMMGWGLGGGGMRWRDVRFACPPGQTRTLRIPLWNADAIKSLQKDVVTLVRIHLLDPSGFRPITHDLLLVPQKLAQDKPQLLIGPDVVPK